MESIYGWWLPPDISTHGHEIDRLIDVLHWFMLLIFVGWAIFFVYCLLKFRAREGHKASYNEIKAKPSKYAEIFVVIFEAVLLIGLAIPTYATIRTDFPSKSDNPVEIRVVAEQFQWNFHYPGEDGKFGRTSADLVNSSNLIGLDSSDPAAGDDFMTAGVMHVPVDTPVVIQLSSKDVIHSFFIPILRVKQDTIPGMVIPLQFQATKTHKEMNLDLFSKAIACAQLCGNNHYRMSADLYVDSQEDYESWLAEMASGGDEEEEEEEEEDDDEA